jgi:hypothetical protein
MKITLTNTRDKKLQGIFIGSSKLDPRWIKYLDVITKFRDSHSDETWLLTDYVLKLAKTPRGNQTLLTLKKMGLIRNSSRRKHMNNWFPTVFGKKVLEAYKFDQN